MRFLQTEWHRHERDRNSWDIEKQEMKSRIASLEGSARRADATQRALRKYVTILEQKVKEQAAKLKASGETPEPATKSVRAEREALIKERLGRKTTLPIRFTVSRYVDVATCSARRWSIFFWLIVLTISNSPQNPPKKATIRPFGPNINVLLRRTRRLLSSRRSSTSARLSLHT